MEEGRRISKVKRGCVTVRVGLEDEGGGFQKFTIPISHLYHPQFEGLLEKSREVYGYHSSGPLKLPCSADDFHNLRWLIERESQGPLRGHGASSLSFRSC